MAIDPERLSEEERAKFQELLSKAYIEDDPPADLLDDDPPDPEVRVGPLLRGREELQADFEEGVKAKGARFIRRISTPKTDPIKAGASDLAEDKYSSKMSVVIDQKRRQKKLAKMTFEDWATEVAKLRPDDWVTPTVRKADKWGKKWDELDELRLYIKQKVGAMPVDTAAARTAKVSANLECMRILGEFSKGVITITEARSRVDDATR